MLTTLKNDGTVKADKLDLHFEKPRDAKGAFRIHYFKDHDHYVAFIPSLNLTAYGDNQKEVDERLDEVINDFVDNLMHLGKEGASKELRRLGWKSKKFFPKKFLSEVFVDKEGILKNFNLPAETEVRTSLVEI